MRWELDKKRQIVDFYIEDEAGVEHHAAMSFSEFKDIVETILQKMRTITTDEIRKTSN